MPTTSIICGSLLILIGIVGYIHGVMTDHKSITALIPAIFGILLVLFGALSQANENLRKHLMHAAALVAVIGFLATAGRLLSKISELTMSAAALSQIATALICLIFVIMAVRSFVAARRERSVV